MAFVANKSIVVNGAITTQYVIEHPTSADANVGNPFSVWNRFPHIEVINMTAGIIYVAFDRAVVPPAGVGVQGAINVATSPRTGAMAATPGDFDLAVTSGNGWGAIDSPIPSGSKYLSVYIVAAGIATVNYGTQL